MPSGVRRGSGRRAGRPSARPPTAGKTQPSILEICPFLCPSSLQGRLLSGFCLNGRPASARLSGPASAALAGTEGATMAGPMWGPQAPAAALCSDPAGGTPPPHPRPGLQNSPSARKAAFSLPSSRSWRSWRSCGGPPPVTRGLAPCPGDRPGPHAGQSELSPPGIRSDRQCHRLKCGPLVMGANSLHCPQGARAKQVFRGHDTPCCSARGRPTAHGVFEMRVGSELGSLPLTLTRVPLSHLERA